MKTQPQNTKSFQFQLPDGVALTGFEAQGATVTKLMFDDSEQENLGAYPTAYQVSSSSSSVIAKVSVTSSVSESIPSASCHVTLDLTGDGGWVPINDSSTYPNDLPIIFGSNNDGGKIPINVAYTRQYLLAPGVKIEEVTVLNQASGYFTLTNGTELTQVKASGGTFSSAPVAVSFNVYGTSPYFTAKISLSYYETATTTASTHCLITFKLTGKKWWEQQGSTILGASGNSGNLPIVPPTGNSGAGPETLNKEMVYLLDVNTNGNMLFRGNSPLAGSDKPIDFQTLHEYMKEQYEFQSAGVSNPKAFPAINDYVLCEIALLSTASEAYEIAYSVASYGSQSTQKSLQKKINDGKATSVANEASGSTPYPASVVNTPTDANGTTIYAQMYLWQVEPGDNSYDIEHGKRLFNFMNTPSTIKIDKATLPIIYYIHCCNGHDRTGIVSSIYMIEKSNAANPGTNSALDLTEQYIRGTTINYLPNQNGPQLYSNCVYYQGSQAGKPATSKSRCYLIHAPKADHPHYLYRTTVEDAYNTIKGNSGTSKVTINSAAEQGNASTAVYVMDDPSPVPSAG